MRRVRVVPRVRQDRPERVEPGQRAQQAQAVRPGRPESEAREQPDPLVLERQVLLGLRERPGQRGRASQERRVQQAPGARGRQGQLGLPVLGPRVRPEPREQRGRQGREEGEQGRPERPGLPAPVLSASLRFIRSDTD